MDQLPARGGEASSFPEENSTISRRRFLVFGSAIAGAGMAVVASCHKSSGTGMSMNSIDLGTGDIGILNYAYALEQLEAAFYIRVADQPYTGISADESAMLTDIRDHEIAHREFFQTALGDKAIQALTPDFSSVDFSSRTSVLETARAFEDLGVQAYNGAGQLITSPDYLVLAGKIVSVEARHAAYIRDLLNPGSFADDTVIDANGLDGSQMPVSVLATANLFLETKVSGANLPTT